MVFEKKVVLIIEMEVLVLMRVFVLILLIKIVIVFWIKLVVKLIFVEFCLLRCLFMFDVGMSFYLEKNWFENGFLGFLK